MTYNVFGGTLSLNQSINSSEGLDCEIDQYWLCDVTVTVVCVTMWEPNVNRADHWSEKPNVREFDSCWEIHQKSRMSGDR